ncbi:hypothetical protein MZM54_28490 [[Brevibacterium] frigoritolerans]|nr:hypothetical protein [Peribacillus frigoritolerans]
MKEKDQFQDIMERENGFNKGLETTQLRILTKWSMGYVDWSFHISF